MMIEETTSISRTNRSRSRDDEAWCESQFDEYLSQLQTRPVRAWRPGSEPPDRFLELEGTTYAVEISILPETVETPQRARPERSLLCRWERFTREIEDAACQGQLTGSYEVLFKGPVPNPGQDFADVKEAALGYISSTQHLESSAEQDLLSTTPGVVSIRKWCNTACRVGCSYSPEARWRAEVVDDLARKLCLKIEEKISKLKEISAPRILLLENRLSFVEEGQPFEGIRPNQIAREFFEGIFVLSRTHPIVPFHIGQRLRSSVEARDQH